VTYNTVVGCHHLERQLSPVGLLSSSRKIREMHLFLQMDRRVRTYRSRFECAESEVLVQSRIPDHHFPVKDTATTPNHTGSSALEFTEDLNPLLDTLIKRGVNMWS
jgi:hypothetical protein